MKSDNLKAVEALREKIRIKEEEVRQLKIVVNGFYTDENEAAPYANVGADNTATLGSLRSDLFYGNTLAEAAQIYLEMRKASGLGSASVNEIYTSLKTGGYKFDTANEEYAKNGVRISLRKNASIFHQLPGGDYGLCVWYGVKAKNDEQLQSKKRGSKRHSQSNRPKSKSKEIKDNPTDPNGASTANDAGRRSVGIADNSGTVTVGALEDFVQSKNRRMKEVLVHFGVAESTVKKLLEPASRVYTADRGWLKIRQQSN